MFLVVQFRPADVNTYNGTGDAGTYDGQYRVEIGVVYGAADS